MSRRKITETTSVVAGGTDRLVHLLDDGSWVTSIPVDLPVSSQEIKAALAKKIASKRGEMEALVHIYDAVCASEEEEEG